MANFGLALEIVLKNEGGFVDDPEDAGGATKEGISLRFLQSLNADELHKCSINKETINIDTIKQLTESQINSIYYNEFWLHAPYEQLTNQEIANNIFDSHVSMGLETATKILQRAINQFYGIDRLIVDGQFGNATLATTNALCNLNSKSVDQLKGFFILKRISEYVKIIYRHPEDVKFINGWSKRAKEIN